MNRRIPPLLAAGIGVAAAGFWAYSARRGDAGEGRALADDPRPVAVSRARPTEYRPTRSYVGAVEPWLSARVGPQLISAYVETVLVRPGATVKRGEVLATLDCRNASVASKAVSMMARAIEAKQKAAAKEAARLSALVADGFVAANEVDKKLAESASQEAELLAAKAKLIGSSLQVDDCVLRAPFDGEIGERLVDPGAFVRPGTPIVTVVDRSTVRIRIDVPEVDFALVAAGTTASLRVVATGRDLKAAISRRAPVADPSTRTVRVEIDFADAERSIPVGTTATVTVPAGTPRKAFAVPLEAAVVKRGKAKVFVVENGIAHARTLTIHGEQRNTLFVDETLGGEARVVVEGRALLHDGDRVVAHELPDTPVDQPAASASPPPAASVAAFPLQ